MSSKTLTSGFSGIGASSLVGFMSKEGLLKIAVSGFFSSAFSSASIRSSVCLLNATLGIPLPPSIYTNYTDFIFV